MKELWNDKVKRLLRERKITHDMVGEALGVKKPSISQRLTGKSNMSVEELMVICGLLGMTMDELCRDDPAYPLDNKDAIFIEKFRSSSAAEKSEMLAKILLNTGS